MSTLEVKENAIVFNDRIIDVGSRILDARVCRDIVVVLIDPDSYVSDPEYRRKQRAGLPAARNLRAYSSDGEVLWEAEMPEQVDYYGKIISVNPIEVYSFSGFRCRIDPQTGKITSKHFMK